MKENEKMLVRRKDNKKSGLERQKMVITVAFKCLKIVVDSKARSQKRVGKIDVKKLRL